jgi:hypothetical protein
LYSTIRRRYKECASDDDDMVARLSAEPPTRRGNSATGEAVLNCSPPRRGSYGVGRSAKASLSLHYNGRSR